LKKDSYIVRQASEPGKSVPRRRDETAETVLLPIAWSPPDVGSCCYAIPHATEFWEFEMDLGIAGKRALVIGGSAGLGYAVSERLAQEGVNLVIFSRDSKKLETARDALTSAWGVKVDYVAGDITNPDDIEKLKQAVVESGGLEILVLNTPPPPRPQYDFLDETDDQRWEDAYQWQLKGALLILRKFAPLLVGSGWGRIVAITSASVKEPLPKHALSTIFRAGVQAALKTLSMELAEHGVTVNSVAPAVIITDTYHAAHNNVEERLSRIPMKRAGKPEELSAAVAFFASDLAGFTTGATLQIDGGVTRSLV
jgi:3-oxoacyl-[acyl-carrier protein] reductase